jgi:hypothetical protein
MIQRRVDWLLARMRDRGAGLTSAEMDEHLAPRASGPDLEGLRSGFATWGDRVGEPMTVASLEVDDQVATVALIGERERRWELVCRIEEAASSRIAEYRLERALPEGVEIRDAEPADASALAELYRSVPMVAGDLHVTIDLGDDYFVSTRLMPERRTLIATDHGRAVGLYTGTRFPAMLNGRDCTVILGCHTRIDAGKAGGGVWSRMNRVLVDHFSDGDGFDAAMAFVLTGNAAASRLTTAGAWPAGPVRAVIPCDAFVGGGDGGGDQALRSSARRATLADAAEIVEILNEAHAGRELFRPHTTASLTARLERAPDLYGWSHLWVDQAGAVIGVGGHRNVRVTTSPEGGESRSVRAIVYDYGYRLGDESSVSAFLALLAAAARAAAADGATHLSIFTSEPAPQYGLLTELAESLEHYDLLVPPVPPDADAERRGVYVDQTVF